jgi:hypothetical protein
MCAEALDQVAGVGLLPARRSPGGMAAVELDEGVDQVTAYRRVAE